MRASPGDTIVAISTAVGPGAIAIVRLSGARSLEIADSVFRGSSNLSGAPSHSVHHGHVFDADGREADEVLATVLRSPSTYTTEDMVEFGCHGGAMPARRVLEVCLDAGARLARRGEFTERAFLSGRLDLVQAEAVADVVGAKTRRGLEIALGQLEGGLSGRLWKLRTSLLDVRAEIEAQVDVGSDEVQPGGPDVVLAAIATSRGLVAELLSRCELGIAVRDGISVAIVGRPNVGKSSLMNALLMRDRSIVTPLPGTTRDAIEEFLHLEGVPVRLIDTAGWRDATDEAEQAGVERARAAAAGAAIVVLVVDASTGVGSADDMIASELEPARTVIVGNKIDLGAKLGSDELAGALGGSWSCAACVSAKEGEGLDELRGLLVTAALGSPPGDEEAHLTNVRHVVALKVVDATLARAAQLTLDGAPPEVVAVEVADAAAALGEVTGETTPEDVLERIFERFCVGK
jgi:tRNA modification GTPase